MTRNVKENKEGKDGGEEKKRGWGNRVGVNTVPDSEVFLDMGRGG